MSLFRGIGAVNPIPVKLPRPHVRQVNMPDMIGIFRNQNPVRFSNRLYRIKQAELYTRGVL
jgi:hypothetical protein